MTDESARTARLMNVIEAVVAELDRQGLLDIMDEAGFDPDALAKVVIKAADGDVVPFKRPRVYRL